MAVDKLVDSSQLDANLTSIANAIRTKGGTSANLSFPNDFITAINAISGDGGGGDSSTESWQTYYDGNLTVSNKSFRIPDLDSLNFGPNETWKITYDGTEYIRNVEYTDAYGVYYIGNLNLANGGSGEGDPFLMYNWPNYGFTGYAEPNGTHTLILEKYVEGSVTPSSDNSLSNKIAAFTGDSICAGHGYAGGYAGIIGTQNNMTIQNLGVSDGCIAPYSDQYGDRFVINTSIADMRSDADFVILEGGGNDADYGITLGSLTNGYSDTLDTNTFAGAFENMLKSAIAKFPNAKIGYIFIHKCVPYFDSRTTGSYYNIAKAACEKWGIPYCDLNTCVPPLGYIDNLISTYTVGDGIHPNELGYKTFYVPQITAFMKLMLTDYSSISKSITTNGTYLASDDNAKGYSSVVVNVQSSSPNLQSKTVTPTGSAQTITADSPYDGLSSVEITALTTLGATTYNTSTTDQTIASGRYITGTQTIKAVKVSGLSSENIASGVTVKIGDANDDDRIASVTGTLSFQTIRSGSSAPSSSLGNDGDIYIQG